MNDFTKVELEYISDCVDFGIMDKKRNNKFLYLENKIQSLIDNYCEHKIACTYDNYPVCINCDKEF